MTQQYTIQSSREDGEPWLIPRNCIELDYAEILDSDILFTAILTAISELLPDVKFRATSVTNESFWLHIDGHSAQHHIFSNYMLLGNELFFNNESYF